LDSVIDSIRGVINQLDPLNTGNKIIFYAWLVIYIFTTIALWRSQKAWVRLICLILNQVFSIGFILSWGLAIVIAADQWKPALVVAVSMLTLTLVLFRRRDPHKSKRSLSGNDLIDLHRQWMPSEPEDAVRPPPVEAPEWPPAKPPAGPPAHPPLTPPVRELPARKR